MYLCSNWTKKIFRCSYCKILDMNDCMKFTTIVSATASESAASQYIAPYVDVL